LILLISSIGVLWWLLKDTGSVTTAANLSFDNPNQLSSNMNKLDAVHPKLKDKVLQLIHLAKNDGFNLTVTQGLRTIKEQNGLYAQGRTDPGKKVTNAKGGTSWHNYGLAVDLAFLDNGVVSFNESKFNYALIGKWASQVGLFWGGNFKSIKDKPHVQLTGNLTISQALDLAKNGLQNVWRKI
jgi:peptidoglycan LD-endopeptidase CwlK